MQNLILNIRVSERRDVVLSLAACEPRPVPYSRSGSMYRPQELHLSYSRNDGGRWVASTPRLRGQRLKKDGTPSVNTTDERLYASTEVPGWVQRLMDEHMPGGAS